MNELPIVDNTGKRVPPETDQTRAAEALAERADKLGLTLDSKGWDPTRDPAEVAAEARDAALATPVPPLAQLYAALAEAQGAFPEIPKKRVAKIRMKSGGEFKFKYSDLSDLIGATRPALSKNGLAQFQYPSVDNKFCVTVTAHKSGITIEGKYPIHPGGDGRMHPAQDWAISYAYARRYGLSAMLGIAAEETIEVDKPSPTKDSFESTDRDGILSVRGAKFEQGATKAEKARAFSVAIEEQIGEAKTLTGLEGVWERNKKVINRLQDKWSSDYSNVFDCYAARETELKAED